MISNVSCQQHQLIKDQEKKQIKKIMNPRNSYQEEHSSYFKKLEEQLLQKSNRYTSLISKKSGGKSLNQILVDTNSYKKKQIQKKKRIETKPVKNNSFSYIGKIREENQEQVLRYQKKSKQFQVKDRQTQKEQVKKEIKRDKKIILSQKIQLKEENGDNKKQCLIQRGSVKDAKKQNTTIDKQQKLSNKKNCQNEQNYLRKTQCLKKILQTANSKNIQIESFINYSQQSRDDKQSMLKNHQTNDKVKIDNSQNNSNFSQNQENILSKIEHIKNLLQNYNSSNNQFHHQINSKHQYIQQKISIKKGSPYINNNQKIDFNRRGTFQLNNNTSLSQEKNDIKQKKIKPVKKSVTFHNKDKDKQVLTGLNRKLVYNLNFVMQNKLQESISTKNSLNYHDLSHFSANKDIKIQKNETDQQKTMKNQFQKLKNFQQEQMIKQNNFEKKLIKLQKSRNVYSNICNRSSFQDQNSFYENPYQTKKLQMQQYTLTPRESYSAISKVPLKNSTAYNLGIKYLHIKDFIILGQIGEGKVGTVYIAKHIKTNFICALKIINKQILNEYVIVQLIRQIKIQFYLDHPNIVQLYAFFSDKYKIYLMMQLCYSGNLYTHLKKTRILPQNQIKLVIKQVCYALQYMHDNEIIHRDLKPQNILFHQNVIKICDFGWAVYSPLLRDTLCGTPIYASPELVQKKKYGNKIDVWNVGVLTYQLLCGRVPFQIRSQEDLYKIVIQDIHFPKFIPISQFCKDFINCCLKKCPDKRFSISKLLQHPFLCEGS